MESLIFFTSKSSTLKGVFMPEEKVIAQVVTRRHLSKPTGRIVTVVHPTMGQIYRGEYDVENWRTIVLIDRALKELRERKKLKLVNEN
jgi:hypothetical protein